MNRCSEKLITERGGYASRNDLVQKLEQKVLVKRPYSYVTWSWHLTRKKWQQKRGKHMNQKVEAGEAVGNGDER